MSFSPDHFLVLEALAPGKGWTEPTTLFTREDDGRYRVASGSDIVLFRERFPNFFRQTLDGGDTEECGAKQIVKMR